MFLNIFISSFIFAKQTTHNFSLKCLKDVTVKMKRSKIMTVLLWIANRHDEHLLEVTLKKIIKKQQNMMTRSLLRPCDSQLS